ncbi:MAG TPA: hypothetical protein VEP30_01035 [Chthoniobacterales bacterium]|nr:hypothetical protein [Chthoniobacterales bacterium]
MTEPESTELLEHDRRELHNLLFGVRRSIRYHNHRRRFFDAFDKFTKILAAVAGSAAFATALSQHQTVTGVLAAIIAIFSAADLIIGAGPAARLHADLAKRFAELEATIVRLGSPKPEKIRELVADRLMIEADEPPILRVLDSVVYNELCKALGYEECDMVKIGWFQSLMSQLVDLWPSKIKKQPRSANSTGPQPLSA